MRRRKGQWALRTDLFPSELDVANDRWKREGRRTSIPILTEISRIEEECFLLSRSCIDKICETLKKARNELIPFLNLCCLGSQTQEPNLVSSDDLLTYWVAGNESNAAPAEEWVAHKCNIQFLNSYLVATSTIELVTLGQSLREIILPLTWYVICIWVITSTFKDMAS